MWITAEAVRGIPDLDQFNEAVDKQMAKVRTETDRLDEDNFFENMSESRVERWEKMLPLTPRTTDTLEERRFAVHAKVIDKLPYSYRVILRELRALAEDAEMETGYDEYGATATIRIGLASESKITDVAAMLDKKLPLDVYFEIIVMYNTWEEAKRYTWGELKEMTWGQVKTDENL